MSPPQVIPSGADSRAEATSRASTPPQGPVDPLELLLKHLQDLVQVDAAAFLAVDARRTRIEPAAQWFASAAMRDAFQPTLSRPYDRSAPGLAETALERGRSLFLPRIEDWEAAPRLREQFVHHAGEAAAAAAWEVYRRGSVIACPVRTPMGHSLGVLIVGSCDPGRPLRRADLKLIEVLSDLAALALERSQMLAAEAARGRTEMLLKRAAEGMSASLESEDVYRGAVEHAVRLTGAEHGLLSRIGPGDSRLVTVSSTPGGQERMDAAVVREVARTRAPRMGGTPPRSMHVPVTLGPRLFGVLSVAREGGPPLDADMFDLLQRLARTAAAGIANAIDFERERRIARALTRGFVPESLPRVAGYELGLLYEPAESQPTGGDLYGAWTLPDGRLAVLIGDVAGKGVETAALSAMARFFIEARSWSCASPAQVLEEANTMLESRLPSDTFVTAFLAMLAPEGARYANAGHVPPLFIRAGAAAGEAPARGLPLGIQASTSFEDRDIDFEPGDLMLVYTDGLVEARRAGEMYGAERLQLALADAATHSRDPDGLVRAAFDDVRAWAGTLSDDAVALAIRRRTEPQRS
jgi:GAF domain-containing protein